MPKKPIIFSKQVILELEKLKVTRAYIQVITTIHLAADQKGEINFVTRSMVYNYLSDLYDKPITESNFYESFNKMSSLGILESKEMPLFKHSLIITIPNFMRSDFVLVPPEVFSEEFIEKAVSEQIQFYKTCPVLETSS